MLVSSKVFYGRYFCERPALSENGRLAVVYGGIRIHFDTGGESLPTPRQGQTTRYAEFPPPYLEVSRKDNRLRFPAGRSISRSGRDQSRLKC